MGRRRGAWGWHYALVKNPCKGNTGATERLWGFRKMVQDFRLASSWTVCHHPKLGGSSIPLKKMSPPLQTLCTTGMLGIRQLVSCIGMALAFTTLPR